MGRHLPGMFGLLLAGAGLLAMPAAAQVESEVTASNLRVVLVDLTPDDGETPWFQFTEADLSPLTAASAVTPTGGREPRARDAAERSGLFTFSPNTRLSLALDVRMAMQAAPLPQYDQVGTVWAAFLATATWGPPRDRWERRDSDDIYGDVGLVSGSFRPRFDRSETLWLSFDNTSAYAGEGDFRILLTSDAYAPLSPVPEPSTSAMLVLGVGLLGVRVRRRARAPTHRAAASSPRTILDPDKYFS